MGKRSGSKRKKPAAARAAMEGEEVQVTSLGDISEVEQDERDFRDMPSTPLSFDVLTEAEGYKLLGVKKGIPSPLELEKRIMSLLQEIEQAPGGASDHLYSQILGASIAVIAPILASAPELSMERRSDPIYVPEPPRNAARQKEIEEKTRALWSLRSLYYHFLNVEIGVHFARIMPSCIPTSDRIPLNLRTVFVNDIAQLRQCTNIPVLPKTVEDARNLLGISASAGEEEVSAAMRTTMMEATKRNESFYSSRIYGAVILLGVTNQNGLKPNSKLILTSLAQFVDLLLHAALENSGLDRVSKEVLVQQVSMLHSDVVRWRGMAKGSELTRGAVPRAPDAPRGTQEREEQYVTEIAELRNKRKEDQIEIGKLRGALKRAEAALEKQRLKAEEVTMESLSINESGSL